MDLDENELKETKKKNGSKKDSVKKERIRRIIKDHIDEMNREEWYNTSREEEKKIKFEIEEELERVLTKLMKEE